MSETDVVNAALAAHVATVNSCDIDANLAGFPDDQVYMPPNVPPMHGKPELKAAIKWWIENFEVNIDMSLRRRSSAETGHSSEVFLKDRCDLATAATKPRWIGNSYIFTSGNWTGHGKLPVILTTAIRRLMHRK